MFATHGDVLFADRAERIAYNALPATWASPKGGDMWVRRHLNCMPVARHLIMRFLTCISSVASYEFDHQAHQYLQAVNEMSATRRGDDYVWTHDNGDSET